jgi:fatty-acyl-CoA synthase
LVRTRWVTYLILVPNLLHLLEPQADKLSNVTHFVIMGEPGKPLPETTLPNVIDYEALLARQPTSYAWLELSENEAAAMCYTRLPQMACGKLLSFATT